MTCQSTSAISGHEVELMSAQKGNPLEFEDRGFAVRTAYSELQNAQNVDSADKTNTCFFWKTTIF